MGSLPNLHELEQIERKREKRREREMREQLAREVSRERERLNQRKVSYLRKTREFCLRLFIFERIFFFCIVFKGKGDQTIIKLRFICDAGTDNSITLILSKFL